MLKSKVNFDRICYNISNWKWNELKVGIDKSIISYGDIISYAKMILSEEIEQFDCVLELSIAEEDEVEELIFNLVQSEEKPNLKEIDLKWIFAIIYDAYIHSYDMVYDVVEDVYAEFDYPIEISNLIGYMPSDDSRTLDEKLSEYIAVSQKNWIKE